jgi:CheY-like chemotaxis protein
MMARIIIVDDNTDLVESLAAFLRARGHDVDTASDGAEAIECYRQKDYDIGFMDVRMPVMNGADSYIAIRRLKPDVRIVMMTGFDDDSLEVALQAGALGPLTKPFPARNMLRFLEAA